MSAGTCASIRPRAVTPGSLAPTNVVDDLLGRNRLAIGMNE